MVLLLYGGDTLLLSLRKKLSDALLFIADVIYDSSDERIYIDGLPVPRWYLEEVEEEWCSRYIIV